MKILIVNSHDIGGAANACLRLHEGLIGEGIESNVLLRNKARSIGNTYQFEAIKKKDSLVKRIINKLKRVLKISDGSTKENDFIKGRSPKLELFSYPFSSYDITRSNLYKEADIINLHWAADFLDYETFLIKTPNQWFGRFTI